MEEELARARMEIEQFEEGDKERENVVAELNNKNEELARAHQDLEKNKTAETRLVEEGKNKIRRETAKKVNYEANQFIKKLLKEKQDEKDMIMAENHDLEETEINLRGEIERLNYNASGLKKEIEDLKLEQSYYSLSCSTCGKTHRVKVTPEILKISRFHWIYSDNKWYSCVIG